MRRFLLLMLMTLVGCTHTPAQVTITGGVTLSGGVSIQQGAACDITTTSLPSGQNGVFYQAFLNTANCVAPLSFSVSAGTFPGWATLNPTTGEISGIPFSGSFSFTIKLVDSGGVTTFFFAAFSITSTGSGLPALPDASLLNWDTSRASNSAAGPYVCVGTLANAGAIPGGCSATFTTSQLQTALNSLACDNILVLQNTRYIQQAIQVPDVACTDGHWIIVEHDITDVTYPAEGNRIDPSFAGLPHSAMTYYPYPGWNSSPNNTVRHVPQIMVKTQNNVPPISIKVPSSGAGIHAPSHWRFIGLELTRDQTADIITVAGIDMSYQPNCTGTAGVPSGCSAGVQQDCAIVNNLPANAVACMNAQPDHIIFDQIILHGDAQRQDNRAINFGGCRFCAILDSYIYDIKVTASGGAGDAQTYFGGGGRGYTNVGDWAIKNTFSASSTEGSIFCGAYTEPISPATGLDGVPHDVWFWQDFLWKNPLWNVQNGQTTQTTQTIEGVTYPVANDQELILNPTTVQLAVNQVYAINEYWGNDSFGGLNLMGVSTQGIGGGTISVDGVLNGNSTTGTITRVSEHNVGTVPWISANVRTYNYTAPATPGTHTITFAASALDNRAGSLGNSRTLATGASCPRCLATVTVTVVASNPTKIISIAPKVADLQIQPSYVDPNNNGNDRQFCYIFYANPNYTIGAVTWKVDGIAGGNSAVGTITTPSGVVANEAVYCSPATVGTHNITATDGTVVSDSAPIAISASAPMLGYDYKIYTQKNGWECKCGLRVLLENSKLETCAAGQGNGGGQPCSAMLIQSVNQANQTLDGNGVVVNYGPGYTADATVRNNVFRHFGSGFVVVALNVAKGIHRIALQSNLCDDCDYTKWGNGFLKIYEAIQTGGAGSATVPPWTSDSTPLADNISFTHNTIIGNSTSTFSINNNKSTSPTITNVAITSNVLTLTLSSGSKTASTLRPVTLAGLATATFLNNQVINVTSATSTQIVASFTHADYASHADTGTASWLTQFTLKNFTFQDNIISMWGGGSGGSVFINANGDVVDCNTGNTENKALVPCFNGYIFDHNLLVNSTAVNGTFNDPTVTQSPMPSVGFVNYNFGNGGDYRLCTLSLSPTDRAICAANPTPVTVSPWSAGQTNQASDGTDMGANITLLKTVEAAVDLGTRTP